MAEVSSAKASKNRYTVVFEPAEEGGYVVRVPVLPGCVTQGKTFEEAKKNAQEAIDCYLGAARDMGGEVPCEAEGTVVIVLSTDITI